MMNAHLLLLSAAKQQIKVVQLLTGVLIGISELILLQFKCLEMDDRNMLNEGKGLNILRRTTSRLEKCAKSCT